MAGGKHNHKRGAARDKRGHNPINSRAPREHIVVIGGPCNTFNAWWSYVDCESSDEDGFFAAQPAPRTMRELTYYLNTAPSAVPASVAKDPDAWRRAGWSAQGRKDVEDIGWKTSEIEADGPETHDLYWANFVDSAVRLYSKSTPFKAPLRRPQVRRGDVVTFMIYTPAYELRQQVDFSASPYNPVHRKKFGIKGNPEYDPSVSRGPKPVHPPSKPATITNSDRKRMAREQADREKARRDYKDVPLSGQDLDHYILMRTTSENSGDVIKRPTAGDSYYRYLENIINHAVPANDVMTKILYFGHPKQVLHYMGDGSWTGEPHSRYVDESELEREPTDEETRQYEENRRKLDEFYNIDTDSDFGLHNYQYTPPVPQHKDTQGRPLEWKLYWNRFWKGAPRIDRQRIKIARFDYFGHSSSADLMLQWGWGNKKGETPELDVDPISDEDISLTADGFEAVLGNGQLTRDAHACLWGCNTGDECAPEMAKLFGGGVVATTTFTSYEKIVQNDTNMPEPSNNEPWILYTADKAEPVGAR